MNKSYLRNTFKVTGIILLSLLLATCDVGLGPSVDTTAPEISISTPTASAVMKGAFTLSGTASDDGTIKTVAVTLRGLGTNSEKYEYTADVDPENKKWNLSLDSRSENGVKDGSYEITVVATDDSNKSSRQQTTFYVDNTPPVIMVEVPEQKQSSMNYYVQMEGKIYDQSEISNIVVVICDASGNEIDRKDAILSGSSSWKASFKGEEDDDGNVIAPYSLNTGTYYYYVVATDEVGNTSEYFFHKPDVYKKF